MEKGVDEQEEQPPEPDQVPGTHDREEHRWYDLLEVALGTTAVVQTSAGARERLSLDGDVHDATISFDLEIGAPILEAGRAHMLAEWGAGAGLDGSVPTLSGINDDADDGETVQLTQLWYEHGFFEGWARLRMGKVDLTTDFDANAVANSETDQFLSTGFVNSLAVEFPEDNGPGGMLWIAPCEWADFGLGVVEADADWKEVLNDPFVMFEVNLHPKLLSGEGVYRFHAWWNGRDHRSLSDKEKMEEDGWGVGFSFDQKASDFVTLFLRYAWETAGVYRVEHAASAGVEWSGVFEGREEDVLAVALGMAVLGDDWKDAAGSTGVDPANEIHVEAYYGCVLHEHLRVSPHVQWIRNADGDGDSEDVWVFGLRARLSF